ncbi:MAG TPA: signal peptidase II [Stellaceae bacterium]|nr:signal peptidase II [Stellaceae bacterium]
MIGRGLIVALLVTVADQLSKTGIVALFANRPNGAQIRVAPFVNLLLTRNSGISFGMFNGAVGPNSLVFSLAAIAVMAVLIYWLSRVETAFLGVAIGLIIGGAAGNVIDRLLDGSVIDFLDFHFGTWHWPAFNIADSAICVGVVAMLLEGLLFRHPRSQAKG